MTSLFFALLAGAMRALCVMYGWNWFVADPFNAPLLSFFHAYALMLLAQILTLGLFRGMLDDSGKITNTVWQITRTGVWTINLGMLWVIHYFQLA